MTESPRYVQHVSGQGEKWKVFMESSQRWIVHPQENMMDSLDLPKSEYRLCPLPEAVWTDVTAGCVSGKTGQLVHCTKNGDVIQVFRVDVERGGSVYETAVVLRDDYRLRKVMVVRQEHADAAPGGFGGFSDAFLIEHQS